MKPCDQAETSMPARQLTCVSSFLTAHQHILGYLVPYDGENVIKNVKIYSRLFSYDKCEVIKCRVKNKNSTKKTLYDTTTLL